MSTALAAVGGLGEAIETALMTGDLSKLNIAERLNYYKQVCQSLKLNPLTKPFSYIVLNGKLTLYATRDCTDQLRKVNRVSITDLEANQVGDLFIVTATAQDGDGRTDRSTGAINISGLEGEKLANAMMKCETKAKRRVTLSICGLGLMDESEIESLREEGIAVDEGEEQKKKSKPPVSMPRSIDEKPKPEAAKPPKQEVPKTEAKPQTDAAVKVEDASGEIKKTANGTQKFEGDLFIILGCADGEKTIRIPKPLVNGQLVIGAKINLKVVPNDKRTAFEAKEVSVVAKKAVEEDILEGEIVEEETQHGPLDDLFGSEPERKPQTTMEAPAQETTKKGTIGTKRAQRLYALRRQNEKTTGLTEEKLKELMKNLPNPIEHLSDLEVGMYGTFEQIVAGEEDWKPYLA